MVQEPQAQESEDSPDIDLATWFRIMTRRVEQHLKRDWVFVFAVSSLLFRSMVIRCKTFLLRMSVKQEDGTTDITAEELEEGAISICRAL
eukprot:11984926-Karenia_brevis.AAC.1